MNKISDSIYNNYFKPISNPIENLNQNLWPTAAKIASCFLIFPPILLGIAWGATALLGRVTANFSSKTVEKTHAVAIKNPNNEYKKVAYGTPAQWKEWGLEVSEEEIKNSTLTQEKIEEILAAKLENGKLVGESFHLVGIPSNFTINQGKELLKKAFPENDQGYDYINSDISTNLGDESASKFSWVLIGKEVVGRNQDFETQKNEVAKQKVNGESCRVPKVREAIACNIAIYLGSGDAKTRLHGDDPLTYTRCEEKVNGYLADVGGFSSDGLCVFYDYDSDSVHFGVAAFREVPLGSWTLDT